MFEEYRVHGFSDSFGYLLEYKGKKKESAEKMIDELKKAGCKNIRYEWRRLKK